MQGTWEWTDGSAWDYTNWKTNEPNGGTTENCLSIYTTTEWNDNPCDRLLPYVCKIAK
jgi:hypothetical protein